MDFSYAKKNRREDVSKILYQVLQFSLDVEVFCSLFSLHKLYGIFIFA